MSLGGTESYAGFAEAVPERVRRAVVEAEILGFDHCVRPETGRLLALLAAGLPAGSVVGETGTGTGAGLAWMADAARPDVSLVSIERVEVQVHAARRVFADLDNVEIVHGDAADIADHGPFHLLVLDGGPGSGKGENAPIDPRTVLVPGGMLTVDDFTPATEWPPLHAGEVDATRVHWLTHPELQSTEIRVSEDLSILVCRRFDES